MRFIAIFAFGAAALGCTEAGQSEPGTGGTGGIPTSGGGDTSGAGGSSTALAGTTGAGGAAAGSTAGGSAGDSAAGAAGAPFVCDLEVEGEGADVFSSFTISYEALQREAEAMGLPNPELGLGGNLGGLAGADAICQRAAEYSTPCAQTKVWRAFLSSSTEDAIDRIGTGPWYDRLGRTIATSISDLVNERPLNIDPAIETDWPNEFGIPNHNPDGTGDVDNHETLTGSGEDGRLYSQQGTGDYGDPNGCNDYEWTPAHATCNDWTSDAEEGCPRVGHTWYEGNGGSGKHWISVWNEGGCARGVYLTQSGGIQEENKHVGSAGGYGGFYCFAVTGQ